MHSLWSYLWIFYFFVVYDNNYSIVVYGGISLYFHYFKALNNNLEARLFLHVHFYASSDLLMVCRTMQLRFVKLGTVLTYASIAYAQLLTSQLNVAVLLWIQWLIIASHSLNYDFIFQDPRFTNVLSYVYVMHPLCPIYIWSTIIVG